MSQININLEQPPQLGQTTELRSGSKWLNKLWIMLNDIKAITNTVTGINNTINSRIDALDDSKAGINDAEVITGNWNFATGHTPTIEDAPTTDTQAANKKYVDDTLSIAVSYTYETVTANKTASKDLTLVNCGSSDITITLPNTGEIYEVSKIDSGTGKVILKPLTGTFMNDTDGIINYQGTSLKVFKVGTDWRVL